MIKVVLFDVDGVLINIDFFTNIAEKKYGISKSETNKFFKNEFKHCIKGKKDLKVVIEPYLDKWGWNKSVDAYLDEWFTHESSINKELIFYIKELREQNIKCYLATNQEKYRVEYLSKNLSMSSRFDGIYASANLSYRKPEIKFYEKIYLDFPNLKKEEILLWDDTLENVESALKFGFCAEVYTSFDDFKKIMRKYVGTKA